MLTKGRKQICGVCHYNLHVYILIILLGLLLLMSQV